MIGSIADVLVVGVARVAGIDQQDAPAFRRLDRLLQDLPGNHGRAEKEPPVAFGIGRQEAVVGPIVEAVAGDEQQDGISLLGLLHRSMASRMLAAVGFALAPTPLTSTRLTTLVWLGASRFSAASTSARASAPEKLRSQLALPSLPQVLPRPGILVDADGDDVERPALIEVSVALMGNGDGLCLFSDGIGKVTRTSLPPLASGTSRSCSPG